MISDRPDLCKCCDGYLHRQDKSTRRVLKIYDGDLVFATMLDVQCWHCGKVNETFYMADMLPTPNMARLMARQQGRKIRTIHARKQFACVQAA